MVCVMVMRNALLVWFLVFGMLCMGTILLSSASSELDSNNTMVNNNNKCIETERLALLDIKQGLADTYGSLSSWGSSKDDENCCQWSLLECDSDTGHVTHLHLSSLNDGDTNDASNISSSLLLLRNLQYLDLSYNGFDIPIPSFFGSLPNLVHLDLSGCHFQGAIPDELGNLSKLSFLDLSYNQLEGELVLSAAEVMSLRFLDLSHNLLFGEIPDSWKYFEDLIFLNLGNNNFSGRIPMSIRYLHSLNKLILRNNKLYGEFPESLRNCTELGFVDVGLNGLSGTVPAWIGKDLPQLYALVLKSNKFYGSLPDDLCYLSHLHFLDLSMNRLSGNVPQCFSRLIAMTNNGTGTTDHHNNRILSASSDRRNPYNRGCSKITRCRSNSGDVSYLDEALAGWKGKEREFRGNFASLNMIDLSSNKFTGEFPTGIARLLDLKGLNLSRNQFYGKVPVQIGRLFELEVLDLSSNNFSGDIPRSMTGLTFLAYLDLSSNNFSARIPLGGQLQAFNSSMYEGNPGLCGLPLTKRCPGDKTRVEVPPPSNGNEVDEDEILYERWLYISTALGFSTSFWGICVTLLVNRRWRHAYFLFLTNLKDQLYVFIIVHIARLKVRLQG
ncbi:receptor-like protein EIX2 isoform X2 [Daucus carota subsp. sativus]|uniref:receptor-like protein EIX2 isoform X2 n=1 Tax=Daucus carota subsp. sativus TaxID=79200 RepID=UPI003082EC8E